MNIDRFLKAQENCYADALSELRNGRKRSHWIWFIFPQIAGLGRSPTARFYAIRDLDEARAYLNHPLLGARLLECSQALLNIRGKTATEILDPPDDMKLRSSMTLFAFIAGSDSVFACVLERFFQGEPDRLTLEMILPQQAR
ncbi:MAG: DUF1810 domain-containing protein [Mariprofundaceae bacterium]|nr:DUF1810 domain-containing protein [Mariprofundaceae bacterium]